MLAIEPFLTCFNFDLANRAAIDFGCICIVPLFELNPSAILPKPATEKIAIPFEEWNARTDLPNPPTYNHCVILWLNDEQFSDAPLTRLVTIFPQLAAVGSVRLLGPYSSDELGPLRDDLYALPNSIPGSIVARNLKIFSPWATSQKARHGLDADKQFEFNIASDQAAVLALIAELQRRNLPFAKNPDHYMNHIAIVAESDTSYARDFLNLFIARNPASPVYSFTYFRGIDGNLPPTPQTAAPDSFEPAKLAEQSKEAYDVETPAGQAQFDYLRRLVEQMKRRQAQLQASSGNDGFFAIGILGSDVNDNLSILQVLRDEFPEAIIFTTDLDARFSEPAAKLWSQTHNLIIASDYDLSLAPRLQDPIPPFRDAYQTAAFYATLRATEFPAVAALPSFPQAVHIFEISRYGPIDLQAPHANSPDAFSSIGPPAEPEYFNPNRQRLLALLALVSIVIISLLFAGIRSIFLSPLQLAAFSVRLLINPLRKKPRPSIDHDTLIDAVIGIVIALWFAGLATLLFIAARDNAAGKGEPFYWFSGISIWPTEVVRLFAAFLCAALLLRSFSLFQDNCLEIENDFDLLPPDKHKRSLFFVFFFQWPQPERAPIARKIWMRYRKLANLPARLLRSLCLFFAFAAPGTCLLLAFGTPVVPARGTTAFTVDICCLSISMLLLLLLTAIAVDAVLLNDRLIRHLTVGITVWPEKAYTRIRHLHPAAPHDALSALLDIQFFAVRSSNAITVIYNPFIIVTILIFSRMHWFDNWYWSPQLIATIAVPLALSVFCAWELRNTAESARNNALSRLNALTTTDPPPTVLADIHAIIKSIQHQHDGAFARWYEQSIVGSILIPFGGFGLLAILEYLLASHFF